MAQMKKSVVSLVKAPSYTQSTVRNALKTSLDLLGGLDNIIQPSSKVFVKINCLSPRSHPDQAIITHPILTKEIVRLLLELKCEIIIGDDMAAKLNPLVDSCYGQIYDELGIRTVNLKEFGFREVNQSGKVLSKTCISPLLLDSDYILNLPKLKTHAFTVFTGAVKNLYGGIPHGLRLQYHRQFRKQETFSQMLVDIYSSVPPRLTIMDGIVSMEGEGPSAGNTKTTGVIISSLDGVAVDAVASSMVGFNPMDIFTTLIAHERKLGNGKIDAINIIGESLDSVRIKEFKHSAIAIGLLQRKLPQSIYAIIQDQLVLIPEVVKEKCTDCQECVQICPVNAIQLSFDVAWIDKNACIHCMCCHEACRFQAIKTKRRPIGNIIRTYQRLHRKMAGLFSRT